MYILESSKKMGHRKSLELRNSLMSITLNISQFKRNRGNSRLGAGPSGASSQAQCDEKEEPKKGLWAEVTEGQKTVYTIVCQGK